MLQQTTSRVFLVEPSGFRKNEETSVNNAFQKDANANIDVEKVVKAEFEGLVELLRSHGVLAEVMPADKESDAPDAIFPNNWISTHQDGKLVLYPMFAPNRRLERRKDIIDKLQKPNTEILDFSNAEGENRFLEGTGSMVLDRLNKVAYAAIGPRTERKLLEEWGEKTGFKVIPFSSYQNTEDDSLIYHTNVMMSIGSQWAAVCLDSIRDEEERASVANGLKESGRELLELSYQDIYAFGGNILELRSEEGSPVIAMSTRSFEALSDGFIEQLSKHGKVIHAAIPNIEHLGGGGVRCMIAEVF